MKLKLICIAMLLMPIVALSQTNSDAVTLAREGKPTWITTLNDHKGYIDFQIFVPKVDTVLYSTPIQTIAVCYTTDGLIWQPIGLHKLTFYDYEHWVLLNKDYQGSK